VNLQLKVSFIMVLHANIDAKGDCTDHSKHISKVSVISIHQRSIFGTLGIVALVIGVAIAVWIYHPKRITKHRRRHAALLAVTYSPGGHPQQSLYKGGGEAHYQQPTPAGNNPQGGSLQTSVPPSQQGQGFLPGFLPKH
jgi:hypothetical protein